MNKFIKLFAVAAMFASSMAANASVIVSEGQTYCIGDCETTFIGNVQTNGGAGVWNIFFESDTDPLDALFEATIGGLNLAFFTNLTVSWRATSDDFVFATTPAVAPFTTLSTTFTDSCGVCIAFDTNQYLSFQWDDSDVSTTAYGFDFSVQAVPAPAAFGLMGLGLLGLMGLVSRRFKKQ